MKGKLHHLWRHLLHRYYRKMKYRMAFSAGGRTQARRVIWMDMDYDFRKGHKLPASP